MSNPNPLKPGASVHMMGIGGYGINPLARLMHGLGYDVSGCDLNESPLLPPLRELGLPVIVGHSPEHLDQFQPDALVISSAIPDSNFEVLEAQRAGIPVLKRGDVLCELMRDRLGIAIAGTHGKTTTTAMAAHVLATCGFDPTYIVGGVLQDTGDNAHAGQGEAFVIEADEYDRMFMGLCPQIAVVTTLELDHPDMFDSLRDLHHLFVEFVGLLPNDGLLIAGYDDAEVRKIADFRIEAPHLPTVTYGLKGGEWTADQIAPNPGGGMDFTAVRKGGETAQVSLNLPGLHNVQNGLAALAVAVEVGADLQAAADALSSFHGVGRRFEIKGVAQDVTVVDDYAHHPTAIRATLEAARLRYPDQQVWAVWEPHTYSRTKTLLDDFAAAFVEADHLIITDIFRSRDKETFGLTPQTILEKMSYHRDARHIGPLREVVEHLAFNVRPGDVVIVMSAGQATRVTDDLLKTLSQELE